MKLHIIPEQKLHEFLSDAVPLLWDEKKVSSPCPHCNYPVIYPLMVCDRDVKAFERLIAIADKYLIDKGAVSAMLSELIATAIIAKAKTNNQPNKTSEGGKG